MAFRRTSRGPSHRGFHAPELNAQIRRTDDGEARVGHDGEVRIAVECVASGDLRETSIFRPVAEVGWSNQPPDPRAYWPDHIGDFGPP
jgi:hypothetical protein